jgi:hypothetical protein
MNDIEVMSDLVLREEETPFFIFSLVTARMTTA